MNLETGSISRQGGETERNGDACVVDAELGVFAVADGLGGSPHGPYASKLAAEWIRENLPAAVADVDAPAMLETLRQLFAKVNAAIIAAAPEWGGPAYTTLTTAVIRGSTLFLAHSGDSRAYLVSGGAVQRLTEDHTLIADMVPDGLMNKSEAHGHPRRNILSGCLGLHRQPKMQTQSFDLRPGQALLLCTDGVSAFLAESELASCAQRTQPSRRIAEDIADKAKANGSTDDMTVVVVKFS